MLHSITSITEPAAMALVSRLLYDVSEDAAASAEARGAALFWLSKVHPVIERGDVDAVAHLFHDMSQDPDIPGQCREQARHWSRRMSGRGRTGG
jgi:hypothetical protein